MKLRKLMQSALIRRSQFYCEYCGVDLLSHPRQFESFVLDHLKPRSIGGPNSVENLEIGKGESEKGRVEKWRGGLGGAYRLPALSFASASLARP